MQFLLFNILLVDLFIAVLEPCDVLKDLLELLSILLATLYADDTIVNARIFLNGHAEVIEFFLRNFLLLQSFQHALQFPVVHLYAFLYLFQLVCLLLQSPQVFSLLDHQFLLPLRLELFNSHVRRPPLPWFQQRLVKGLLIRYEPPLIVYFLLVLDQPLPPDLGLLLLDLFGDEILQPEIGALLEEVLNVLKLLLALSKRALDDLRVTVGLQLHCKSLQVERGGVEDIIDLVGEQFNPFFQLTNRTHNIIIGMVWMVVVGVRGVQIEMQCLTIISQMDREFETSFKKRNHRERFYSSMGYEDYCDLFGPPAPLVKPQQDPADQMPLFDLQPLPQPEPEPAPALQLDDKPSGDKMETIPEIDGSQNFTQNLQRSPRLDIFSSGLKSRELPFFGKDSEAPKRVRVRMRSQSDNSEYLIFNFLQRSNENGRKRRKLDE